MNPNLRSKRSTRLRKWILIIASALALLALCACSDEGRVRYADEAFVRELCGLPPIAESVEAEDLEEGDVTGAEGTGEGVEGIGTGTGAEGSDGSEGSSEGSGSGEGAEGSGEGTGLEGSEGTGTGSGEGGTGAEGTGDGTEETLTEGALLGTAIGEESEADARIRERLQGTFLSTPISVSEDIYNAMESASFLVPYLSWDETKLVINAKLQFSESGRAVLSVEEESYQALMDYVTAQVTEAAYAYFDSYVQKYSSYLSTKQYLKLMGISLEDYVGDVIRKAGGELDDAAMRYVSFYAVRGDRIYLGETVSELSEGKDYLTFLLRGSLLTLMEYYQDGKQNDRPLGMNVELPLSLTKQF
ncbi:MAG: hypothetical protein J6Q02_02660 [Lachnospiraceae bacterium]|nr:hypothetical protein [Lachnospiraceae bacterium]